MLCEGRHLKPQNAMEYCKKCQMQGHDQVGVKVTGKIHKDVDKKQFGPRKAIDVDDFRPTTPGHSPGSRHHSDQKSFTVKLQIARESRLVVRIKSALEHVQSGSQP
ncbi:hypothetical protein H6P81_010925 [Aristolochia fimbriata]|uniref:Uncharacterized protein n=1 Tax=Aristolochia fimbriata TaxID=158543 RepID=A0AAV7EQ50_ARIFI|nr:hypothetical protein H6P81_010925 [Aristolochia fimbriata]